MASADQDRLLQYIFPTERLPAHTQELLRSPMGRRRLEMWPQYSGRIHMDALGRPQVWKAVMPFVCRVSFYRRRVSCFVTTMSGSVHKSAGVRFCVCGTLRIESAHGVLLGVLLLMCMNPFCPLKLPCTRGCCPSHPAHATKHCELELMHFLVIV